MIKEISIKRSFAAPGQHLCGMAWDGQHLWHSDGGTHRLYCLDVNTGAVLREIPCDEVRTDLAYDGVFLWQIAGYPKRIRVIDPQDGRVEREIALGLNAENACGLLVEGDHYWIGRKNEAVIEQRARADHSVLAQYNALPHMDGLARIRSTMWYSSFEQSLLVGIDLETGEEKQRYRVPGNPTGMCWDGELFWYSDYTHRRLCAVSPD